MKPLPIAPVCLLLNLLAPLTGLATDGTWKSDPSSGEWGDSSNWESGSIASGSTSIATFATSSVTDISISTAQGPTSYSVGFFAFGPGADAFTFTFDSGIDFTIHAGVANESGHYQKFYVKGTVTIASGADFDTGTLFETKDSGTLAIDSGANLANLEIVNDATIELSGGGDFSLGYLSGSGSLIASGVTVLTVGGLDKDSTYSGNLASDSGSTLSLTKTGSGTWTLSGDNSYTGGTTISEGTLVIDSDTATGTGDITLSGGTLEYASGVTQSNDVILETDGTLKVTSGTATQAGVISESGGTYGVTKAGGGTLILAGANTYGGGTTINDGTLEIGSDTATGTGDITLSGGTLAYSDGVTQSNVVSLEADGAFKVSSGSATQAGVISESGGSYSLTKTGGGTLILTGTNTYSGGTTISAGTLQIGDGGISGSLTGDVTNDGMLTFNSSNTIVYTDVISGSGSLEKAGTGIVILAGDNTYSGGTTISDGTLYLGFESTSGSIAGDVVVDGTLIFNRSDNIVFEGVISGTGVVKKESSSTLDLTAASTFSGDTVIDAGAIKLGNTLALQNSTVSLGVDNGLDLNGLDATLGGLSGSGDLALGAQILTVGGNGESTTYSGDLSGTGGLTKTGDGSLILSSTNTFTGETTIDAGKLVVDGSIVDSSLTTINDGGTLGGSGTVGALTIADGGTLSPGNSPGTLSAGVTTWNGGGNYVFEINNATGTAGSNWDLLDIDGTLDLTSLSAENPFTITIVSLYAGNASGSAENFDPAQSYSWILVTASSGISGFNSDNIAIDSSGFQNAPGTDRFSISSNGSQLSVTYSAVPEPGACGIAVALGMGILIVVRRKRVAKKSRHVAVAALFLAVAPLASHAALVTYGTTLTTTIAVGDSPISLGDKFHLTLTIDDSVEDTDPDPDVLYFPNALLSISLSPFATNSGSWDPSSLGASPDWDGTVLYQITEGTAQRSFAITDSPHSGTVIIDSSGTFAYDPEAGIGLEGTTDTFTVRFTDSGSNYTLQGTPYTVVPEPEACGIAIALGIGILIAARRRRLAKKSRPLTIPSLHRNSLPKFPVALP